MDENKVYTEAGVVNISDDVVQTIAAMAVNEVNGATLPTGIADGLVEKVEKLVNARKNYSKNIKVEMDEKNISVESFSSLCLHKALPLHEISFL